MPKLTPVDYDPFVQTQSNPPQGTPQHKLTPVDYDPFVQQPGLGQKLKQRVQDIDSAWGTPATPSTPEQEFVDSITSFGMPSTRPILRTAGAIGGGLADIIGAGASKLYQEYVHPDTKKLVGDIGSAVSPLIKSVAEPVMSGYGKLKGLLPEKTKDIESVANATTLLPVGWGGRAVAKETSAMVGDITSGIAKNKLPNVIRENTSNTIKKEFPKVFKIPPSMQKDLRKSKEFLDKADNSMYDVIKNEHPDFPIKGKGNEPLTNYAENLIMRKKQTWDEIEGMINKTGLDTSIDQTPIINELQRISKTAGVSSSTKIEKDAAEAMIGELKQKPQITLGDAQNELQKLNSRLGGAIPYDIAGKASVDNMYREYLKNAINKAVESLPDNAGFKDLKKLWGSHRGVEENVVKTLNQTLGKSQKINFIDIGSAAGALSAILFSNPKALLAVGAAELLNLARRLSGDINRNLVKLIDKVKKSQAAEAKANQLFEPKSAIGKIIFPDGVPKTSMPPPQTSMTFERAKDILKNKAEATPEETKAAWDFIGKKTEQTELRKAVNEGAKVVKSSDYINDVTLGQLQDMAARGEDVAFHIRQGLKDGTITKNQAEDARGKIISGAVRKAKTQQEKTAMFKYLKRHDADIRDVIENFKPIKKIK